MLRSLGDSPPHEEVRAKAGKAPLSLLYCEECLTNAHSACCNVVSDTPWIVRLHCLNVTDHPSWFVCSECTSQRKRMYDASKVNKHNKKFHAVSNKKARFSSDDFNDSFADTPYISENN